MKNLDINQYLAANKLHLENVAEDCISVYRQLKEIIQYPSSLSKSSKSGNFEMGVFSGGSFDKLFCCGDGLEKAAKRWMQL